MSVNVEIIREEGHSVHFSVSVSNEVLSPIEETVINGYASRANIKGFRPGKAPVNIVKRNFAPDITEAVLSKNLVKFLDEAASKLNIKKIGSYQLEDVEYTLGQAMNLKASVEKFPDFEYKGFENIQLETIDTNVSDAEVMDEIRERAFKNAPFEMVSDRKVMWDDFLIVDYKLSQGESIIEEGEDKWFKVTKDFNIEGFCDHMIDMEIGESKSFQIKLPSEYQDEAWAGKEVLGFISVKSIRVKKIPELNDEWVLSQNLSFKTFDEYKESVKSLLQSQKNEAKKQHDRSQLEKKLLEIYTFEVPDNFLNKVAHDEYHRIHDYYKSMGMPSDWLEQNKSKLKEQGRESALKQVKLELIADRLRSENKLDVTAEEVDSEMAERAAQQNLSIEAFKMDLVKNKRFENYISWIQFEKVWKWLESKTAWTIQPKNS